MEDETVPEVAEASEVDASPLEGCHVQKVIGLLLSQEELQDAHEKIVDLPLSTKIDSDTDVATVTTSVSISRVTLADAGISLVEHDQVDSDQKPLEAHAVQLEDGTTAFIQALSTVEESDSSDAPTKFIDGQAVQLEDGTTAFIHTSHREGLQAVQLEDGTMAYISHSTDALFDSDTTGISLDQLTAASQTLGILRSPNSSPKALALGDKAFRCPYEGCGRLYTTQHHLKVHERSHTGDRPFKCNAEGCGKAFATGYGLKSHTRVHTGETPYKCPEEVCNKAFKTSGDLQKHVRTHTGERPFKCPFEGCDRAFTTSNIRKVHIRTHTGERPYICKEEGCGRAFASATNYKNHIRIHTGEKPYVCTVLGCGKRFTEYSSLYKHHVVHTHSKPYICNFCGKHYRQTSTLAMHRRTTHGIVEGPEECIVDPSMTVSGENTLDDSDDLEPVTKRTRIQFQLEGGDMEEGSLVVQGTTQQVAMVTGAGLSSEAAIAALQAAHQAAQHAVQQVDHEANVLPPQAQQILVVADPAQLVALQQLAQHAQLEGALTATVAVGEATPPTSEAVHLEENIIIEDDITIKTENEPKNESVPVEVTLSENDTAELITYTEESEDA